MKRGAWEERREGKLQSGYKNDKKIKKETTKLRLKNMNHTKGKE